MAIYAIGDIQGCYDELQALLEQIAFDPAADQLWFAGDLVNRGPKSLETLRFIKGLGEAAISVLGNHDLHTLAVWKHRHKHFKLNSSLQPIFEAEDAEELLEWLRHLPLLHHDAQLGYTLVHAGLPPQWDLETACDCAREVEAILQGEELEAFLNHMYGNHPRRWDPELRGWDRARFIVNCFTRLRYCSVAGKLDFKDKGQPGSQRDGYLPWFEVEERASAHHRIVFGHWSTLGLYQQHNVHGIDTGCLWGGTLSALRLDGEQPHIQQYQCPLICPPK